MLNMMEPKYGRSMNADFPHGEEPSAYRNIYFVFWFETFFVLQQLELPYFTYLFTELREAEVSMDQEEESYLIVQN